MSVTLYASGTQTATVTTEHFLSSPNVAGKFRLQVDLVNMAAGDVVELRVYKMVLTAGTQRVVFFTSFSGAQPTDALIAVSEAISNTLTDANAVRFSLKQTFGTGRNFPWAVLNEEDFSSSTGGVYLATNQIVVKKNAALSNFTFVLTDSTNHAPITGRTVTATRSIDGAAFAAAANAVVEISNGWYRINLAASDLNGDVISLRFTATGTDDRNLTILTQP